MFTTAADINECESNNGGCADICENNEGSLNCFCRPGFEFGPGDDSDLTKVGRLCLGIFVYRKR